MFRMKRIIMLLVTILFMSGCASSMQNWKYTSNEKQYTKPISNLTLAVPNLQDKRKNKNSQNAMLALLPLVPYGSINIQVPDGAQIKPTEDFSKAIAEEISNASIFKETIYTNKLSDSDLFLEGTLYSSKLKDTVTFYGLSLPGDLLWLIGAPTGKATNKIIVRYRLLDKNYKVYMDKIYSKKKTRYNFFWMPKGPMFFEEIFKEIALEVVEDIKQIAPQIKIKK